jgi:dTDP-4-dehydrorhamnose 3,5-epimerase
MESSARFVANDRFEIEPLPLAGLYRVERQPLGDARGWLERLFCTELFEACGAPPRIAQINRTGTLKAGTIRGLHFQHPPHTEVKFPAGFAHGLQTLADDTELLYLHTAAYAPAAEDGIDALDPRLAIAWPLPVAERSARDLALAPLSDSFKGITA